MKRNLALIIMLFVSIIFFGMGCVSADVAEVSGSVAAETAVPPQLPTPPLPSTPTDIIETAVPNSPIPTPTQPAAYTPTPTAPATSTFIIDNTIILYTTIQQIKPDITPTPVALNTQGAFEVTPTVVTSSSPFVDYWALRAWPNSLAFDQPIFETFYGEVDSIDPSRYFFNFRPQASPNGRYILLQGVGGYTNSNGDLGTGLWLADLQEGIVRQLLPQAKIATWSPQSDQITYVEGDTVYTLSIDEGATPIPLFTQPNLNGLYARWSPDGQWIAAMTSNARDPEEAGGPEITNTYWIIPTNGDPAWELATRDSFAIEYTAKEMTWSPDSQFLLVRNEVFDLDGRQISPQFLGRAYWLPNQPQLLINSDDGLRLTTVEGVEIAMMGNSFSPAWNFSRNSQKLAYSQSTNDAQTNIFIFDLNTQEDQFIGIVPAAYLSILRWSGDDKYLIMDDGQDITPIWAMNAQPNSTLETILDEGVLVEVVALPNNLENE